MTVSNHDPRDTQRGPEHTPRQASPARPPAEGFGSALRALHVACGCPPLTDLMETTGHDIGRIESAFEGQQLPEECVARCLVIALRGRWLDLSLMYHNASVDLSMADWWGPEEPGQQVPSD
jgi:hypothetical protein